MKHLIQILTTKGLGLRNFLQTDRGATATEYGILMGFIAMVIVGGIGVFGIALNSVLVGLAAGIKTALGIP